MTAAKCDTDEADTEDLEVYGLMRGMCSTQRVSGTAWCWQLMSKRKWHSILESQTERFANLWGN